MRKLYEKSELTFAIVWIVIYCVLQSLANPLNEKIGIEYSASAAFCLIIHHKRGILENTTRLKNAVVIFDNISSISNLLSVE